MITYTIKGVPSYAIKVTYDRDLFGEPSQTYAVLEARVDVEAFRGLEALAEKPEEFETENVSRTVNTKISLEPNPRTQNMKTPVAKAIRTSLLRRDGKFHRLNRGILLTAENFSYDNKTETLTWTEEDPLVHGNLDGAHTCKTIDETVATKEWFDKAKEDGVRPQFVALQILRGAHAEEIPKISEARNFSVNVEAYALEELAKSFEFIKDELAKTNGVRPLVAFKQNEIREDEKQVDIVYVLQLLTLLDNREFNSETQPYVAYWSRKKTVQQFIDKSDHYKRLKGLVRDALALKEYIILNFGNWYDKTDGKTGTGRPRFRRTNECDNEKSTSFHFLPLMKPTLSKNVDYRLASEGLAMPILAALRTIVTDGEDAEWQQDPFKLLDEIGPTLVDALMDAMGAQRNVVVALKRKGVWSALYDKALIHMFEKERKAARTRSA
ncbi:MAG: AIPR family protein [Vulcanimicrobiaceae bacterium]